MNFMSSIMQLMIYLSIIVTVCQTYPVGNNEISSKAEHAGPAPIHQIELPKDWILHSQNDVNGALSNSELKISLLKPEAKTRETVKLEKESVLSKALSLYDNSQKKFVDKTQSLPILDTISEHEKYGNNGDMFDGISRSLINGYEAFSNLLNTLIQKPKEIARSISKGITAQLDVIGGKLVGL